MVRSGTARILRPNLHCRTSHSTLTRRFVATAQSRSRFFVLTVFQRFGDREPGLWVSVTYLLPRILSETTGTTALRVWVVPPTLRPESCPVGNRHRREGDMHRDDLMRSDLLSEILLLGSGVLIFVVLIVIVVAVLAGTPSPP